MKTVRWARPAANKRRILRVQDLVMLGIPDVSKTDLVWDKDNKFEIVMSNKASDSLAAKLPTEFVIFDAGGEDDDESDPILEPLTTIALPQSESHAAIDDQASDDSQELQDDSLIDETAVKQSSKRTRNPVE